LHRKAQLEPSGREAVETLRDVARLRRATRRSLGTPWFPLVYFGVLTMVSAPLLGDGPAAGLIALWVLAGTLGMALTRRHYRRRAQRRGVAGRRRSWWVAWAMFAGCFAAGLAGGLLGGLAGGVIGPIAVVSAGYVVMGVQQRRAVVALAALPAAALAALSAAAGGSPQSAELAFGAALALAGAVLLAVERRRR
jgi:hypothetical protein